MSTVPAGKDSDATQDIPGEVISEIMLNIVLMACWHADMSRPWWPCMPATDASSAFGLGVSFVSCSHSLSREAASHSGSWEHHFRLDREATDPEEFVFCCVFLPVSI